MDPILAAVLVDLGDKSVHRAGKIGFPGKSAFRFAGDVHVVGGGIDRQALNFVGPGGSHIGHPLGIGTVGKISDFVDEAIGAAGMGGLDRIQGGVGGVTGDKHIAATVEGYCGDAIFGAQIAQVLVIVQGRRAAGIVVSAEVAV